jgi:ABC-type Fe3+/spermidine/putrescine transport system ATPase subunit
MRDGRVEQIGRQEDLYMRPSTPFVAGFIGQSNILRGRLDSTANLSTEESDRIALAGRYDYAGPGCLAVRPESIRLLPPGAASARVDGTVKLCTYLGSVIEHVVRLDSGRDMIVRGPGLGPTAAERWPPDERVSLTWEAAAEHVFDKQDRAVPDGSEATAAAAEGGDREWAQAR